jgi:hypothetical protein
LAKTRRETGEELVVGGLLSSLLFFPIEGDKIVRGYNTKEEGEWE